MSSKVRHFVRVGVAIAAIPVYALAQETVIKADEVTLEEVVVTAQKRQESLRDVPLSVEAVRVTNCRKPASCGWTISRRMCPTCR